MKLFLASLATGIIVVGFIIVVLAIVKVLFPGVQTWMFGIWFFCWPLLIMPRSSGPTTAQSFEFACLLGTMLDVVIVSIASFIIFSVKRSKGARARVAVPPPPPSF